MGFFLLLLTFRDGIFTEYVGLFGGRVEEDSNTSEEGDEDPEEESSPETYKEKQIAQFNKHWMWYDMISNLAEGDLLKIQEYYELPIKAILNHLSWRTTKNNIK